MGLKADYEFDCRRDPLVQPALNGDRDALEQLFSSSTRQLYKVALRVLATREDAEDAVQDGYLAALRNLRKFEGRSKFSTWLSRIVLNAALMRLRKTRAHAATSLDRGFPAEDGAPLAARIADPQPSPEEAYAQEERLEIFKRHLEGLPASYRSVLWLRDVQGMATQEAAERLGLSKGTLKSRLHRARREVSKGVSRSLRPRRRDPRQMTSPGTGCRTQSAVTTRLD